MRNRGRGRCVGGRGPISPIKSSKRRISAASTTLAAAGVGAGLSAHFEAYGVGGTGGTNGAGAGGGGGGGGYASGSLGGALMTSGGTILVGNPTSVTTNSVLRISIDAADPGTNVAGGNGATPTVHASVGNVVSAVGTNGSAPAGGNGGAGGAAAGPLGGGGGAGATVANADGTVGTTPGGGGGGGKGTGAGGDPGLGRVFVTCPSPY